MSVIAVLLERLNSHVFSFWGHAFSLAFRLIARRLDDKKTPRADGQGRPLGFIPAGGELRTTTPFLPHGDTAGKPL